MSLSGTDGSRASLAASPSVRRNFMPSAGTPCSNAAWISARKRRAGGGETGWRATSAQPEPALALGLDFARLACGEQFAGAAVGGGLRHLLLAGVAEGLTKVLDAPNSLTSRNCQDRAFRFMSHADPYHIPRPPFSFIEMFLGTRGNP